MTFTATKPKNVETNNGIAWATTIKFNGVVCAHISNDGRGACDDHEWVDKTYIDQFIAEADKLNGDGSDGNLFSGFDKKDHRGQPGADFCSPLVEKLMQEAENAAAREAQLKRDSKKHICALMPGKDHSKGYTIFKNVRPTTEMLARLRAEYPGIKILNPGVEA
ncbi:hypothetical protein phiK7B1_130 [Pseudomonas phage phiK7B1]|nr:hypothetical protein phiK7B1_130 [Pseudomonas phage phiK7B1]